MNHSLNQIIKLKLENLQKASLYRELREIRIIKDPLVSIDGKEVLNFSSNDYLGLSQNPVIIRKTIEGIKKYGVGTGASRLISGNQEYHKRLEDELARFKRKEKALLFGSGYLANIALLSTLPGSRDIVLSDALNHASIIDGCRLSRAAISTYPHVDMEWLDSFLKKERGKYQNVFIVSDSVFSMDGDLVPLPDLYQTALRYNATLILDEAHATGVLGDEGRGIEDYYRVHYPDVIVMGTLGKALGSYGAFVCASEDIIDYLINRARPFIYTTALPPAPVLAAQASLELIQEDQSLLHQLKGNLKRWSDNLSSEGLFLSPKSPIIPIIVGHPEVTMKVADSLMVQGLFIQGIRPPTVARGSSRLRITLSASHSNDQIDFASDILLNTLRDFKIK